MFLVDFREWFKMNEGRHRRLDDENLQFLLESSQNHRENTLFISIYALNTAQACQTLCGPIGLGMYHSALQIGAFEIGYEGSAGVQGTGLFWTNPRRSRAYTFRCSIPVSN